MCALWQYMHYSAKINYVVESLFLKEYQIQVLWLGFGCWLYFVYLI